MTHHAINWCTFDIDVNGFIFKRVLGFFSLALAFEVCSFVFVKNSFFLSILGKAYGIIAIEWLT